MRFQDASRDARAVVYAGVQADPTVARAAQLLAAATTGQRLLARAAMNGQSDDPAAWRVMFPTLFGPRAEAAESERSEAVLTAALDVAGRGEHARSLYRGAIVEALTERLLAQRVQPAAVHRERRILFDGVRSEIHPYDVTVELPDRAEAYDCKWGARGINAEVLLQLDLARRNAELEGARLVTALVVFDSRRSCRVRLARQTPTPGVRLVALESLDALAGGKPAVPGALAGADPGRTS